MTNQLVNDVWLWRMFRIFSMTNVLSALEDSKCQRCQEVSGCQESSCRSQSPSCLFCNETQVNYSGVFQESLVHTLEILGNIFQLRHSICCVSNFFLHQSKCFDVLFTCMSLKEFVQLVVHKLPGRDFILTILDSRNGLPTWVQDNYSGDARI